MVRKTNKRKIAAKVLAAILSVTMGLSTMSYSVPGAVAFAQEAEASELPDDAVTDAASEGTVGEEVADPEDESADAASEESPDSEEVSETDAENDEEGSEGAEDEAEAEAEEPASDTDKTEENEKKDEAPVESEDMLNASYDELVEFTTESSESDGIKTTTSKWDFATAKNTGKNTSSGDSICGIIIGGNSGRVILDSGKDLNVKNVADAAQTGVIYLPIADDTNVVTIKIVPMDSDTSRYVTVGSFDSEVKLVDNKGDESQQSVTFKADLADYVTDKAGSVEGRFIPLYSHGNFKTASIELIETDATTIVQVSGKLSGEGVDKVTGLKFKNLETEKIISCSMAEGGTYSVNLPNEARYAVGVSGTLEYGIDATNDGNIVDLSTGNDPEKEQNFVLIPQDATQISGSLSIVKIDNAKPVSSENLKVTLVPKKNTIDVIDVQLTKVAEDDDYHYTFSALLLPEEEYSIALDNANDYECTGIKFKDAEEPVEKVFVHDNEEDVEITVTAKPHYTVTLDAVTHNLVPVSSVTGLTVKNLDDDYEYSFTDLEGSSFDIDVRDGIYEVTEIITEGSYEPLEHFEVDGENIREKMYLKDTSEKPAVEYKESVTVGSENSDYTTIFDALDAVKRMKRAEGQRVTVVLNDAYYQEQVVVDVPDITFASGLKTGSTISWYYGLGGDSYYSAYLDTAIDKNHLFYDEAHAVDKYDNTTIGQTPGNWGSTVNLKSTATGFKAENITFENSFNFYISNAEKEDIASSGNILDRTKEGADPTLYKSKERACTMYNRGADNIEFYNCNFISSQDTIYTGDANEYSYFYNCTIEGTTDFICGDGNALFDNCDLLLYGFSDQSKSDLVIVASKGSADKGYLFNYCTVKTDKSDSIQPTTSAYLGRPWGTDTEKVAFVNTILESDLIQAKGWTTMNTVPSLNTGLHEFGTRFIDGTEVDLSERVATNIGTDKQGTAANYVLESADGYSRSDYVSSSWTPSYYGADYSALNEELLRYNAITAKQYDFANVPADKKEALDNAYDAVEMGLLADDQAIVDAYAKNLKSAIDAITGNLVKEPVSSLKSGKYSFSQIIELSTETEGANIYYTTDGSAPTAENGILYTSPVIIRQTCTLKAVAVAEGKFSSYVAVYEYEIFDPNASSVRTYDLEALKLTLFDKGAKTDGQSEVAGTDNYFTIIYSASSKVDTNSKSWGTEYSSNQRINFGGAVSTAKNSIKFTTTKKATVTIYWVPGAESRQMGILDKSGATVVKTNGEAKASTTYKSTLDLANPGTYYLGGVGGNNYIFRVLVSEADGELPEKGDWERVPAPVISDIQVDGSDINVTAEGFVNYNGADSLTVDMLDEKGDIVSSKVVGSASDELSHAVTFKPTASGGYTFTATLSRSGEDNKVSEESGKIAYVLPLSAPNITAVTNKGKDSDGKGKLEVVWTKVDEAKKYDVEIVQITEETVKDEATGEDKKVEKEEVLAELTDLTERETVLGGLPIGEEVTVKVYATRTYTVKVKGKEKIEKERSAAGTATVTVTGNNDRTWNFASYGSNASKDDSATVNADGSITIATPSSTKIVPGSTDGLGYYYTRIDPSENFTLTAKIKVNEWPYDNGQEGFGLMVSDAVGEHGDGAAFWNNSYQAATTQIQYNWDPTVKDAEGNYVGGVTSATADSSAIFQEKMRLGIGWIARDGVTLDQKQKAESGQIDTPDGFTTTSGTFETSVASAVQKQLPGITAESSAADVQNAFKNFQISAIDKNSAVSANASYGQLNIIDESVSKKQPVVGTVMKVGDIDFTRISEVRYQIQRNNTGYVLRYLSNETVGDAGDVVFATDDDGNRISYVGTLDGKSVVVVGDNVYEILSQKIIYDTNRNNLTQIDKKYIYAGMFSARKTKVKVEDYKLETVDAEEDYPAEARVVEDVALNALVMSAETSNTAAYDLVFSANADGTLSVEQVNEQTTGQTVAESKKLIAQEIAVSAGKWATVGTTLKAGDNKFNLVFTPAPGYTPGEYQRLVIDNDPEATSKSLEYTVKYSTHAGSIIYVAPGANGDGSTKESPASIYDAVSFAAPGQKIYLAGGTYNLGKNNGGSNKNLHIERGTDGTAKSMITMETDPDDVAAGRRAVLSFADATGTGSAFVLAGNYWHLKNFDVTGSKNGEKGLHIAGKHNVVEMVNAYKNGNTGIEIAREGSVGRDLWPSDNLVLNCTSYLNYDAGFEDADGFAAKITCGEGNRFVGCVSAYNADDGWDLFAKVQSGSIGAVTIENSIAYKNGYLLGYAKMSADGKSIEEYEVFEDPALSVNHQDMSVPMEFAAGNGNGFKLGGDGMSGYHVLRNSYAFANKANGIDSNSCPDIQVFNNISYANGTNISLSTYAKAINSDYAVSGLISIGNKSTGADSIKPLGNQIQSKIYNKTNFFWNGSASVNAVDDSMKATADIFVSTDETLMGANGASGSFVNRDADGDILFNGFLQLKNSTDVADADLKAVLEFIEANGIGAGEVESAEDVTEFVVYAKDVKTLADVQNNDVNKTKLPEGFTWLDSTVLTAPYAGTAAEFAIVNEETGSRSTAVVNFVDVTGVGLTAVDADEAGLFAGEGKSLILVATPVFTPDVKINFTSAGRFAYGFADSKKMGLNESVDKNVLTLTRAASSKEGIANYVATMQFAAGGKVNKLTSNAYSFSTRNSVFDFVYDVEGATVEDDGTIVVEKAKDKFKLNNLKVTNVSGSEKVNVSVIDSKIVKYSGGEFTAVNSGTTFITLTAAGDKTVKKSVKVRVEGNKFAVNVEKLTIDKARNDGASFSVTHLGGATLGEISVARVLKGTKVMADLKDVFQVTKVVGDVYRIVVKANVDETIVPKIATGTYSLVLTSGDDEFDPVTVVVRETRPTAALKQTKKVNLFYKAGTTENTGALKATSKLASVTLSLASEDSDFNLVSDGSSYQLVMTNAAQKRIQENSKNKLATRIRITESFDGYKKAYDRTVNYTVVTETRAPQYVLEMDNSVLYSQLGIKDTEFRILNKATGEYVIGAQIKLADSTSSYVKANKNFTLDEDGGVYKLSTTKSGTAKISIVDPDFSKDPKTKYASDRQVVLNAKLTVNNSKPSVTIANARINGQAEFAAYSRTTSRVTVRNALDYTVRNLELTGNSNGARKILPFIDYTFERNELNQPVIAFSFKDSADKSLEDAIKEGIVKRGSYSFTANYSLNKISGMKTRFTLTVLGNAKATGRVGKSINLVARDATYATVKPVITNLQGTVTGMYFKGAENFFDVDWDSTAGQAKVYAMEYGSYRANTRYRLTPVFTVATSLGEVEIEAVPVYIQVKQTQLKLSVVPVINVKMSDVSGEGTAIAAVTSPKTAEIASMVQLSQKDKFNVSYDAKSGNFYVSIADVKGLKANSTYTVKMGIVPVGNGVGARQQTINIRVKVLR